MIGGGRVWHLAVSGKKFDSATNASFVGAGYVDGETLVVFQGIADIPPLNAMRGPGAPLLWGLV
jgi:hypothetical protein